MLTQAIVEFFKALYQAFKEKRMKDKEREEMRAMLKSEYGEWINLTVINIKNFVDTHKLITKHFIVNAQHDLHLDFDKEHRGLSFNTHDPIKVAEVVARLRKIEGIEVGEIETIVRD